MQIADHSGCNWRPLSAWPRCHQQRSGAARSSSRTLSQAYFETPVFAALIELAALLGFRVYIAPFLPNGKPLQVLGFLPAFEGVAKRNAAALTELRRHGVPLVGLDPAMTLVYRQEYLKVLDITMPKVLLPQEWLIDSIRPIASASPAIFTLLTQCTGATNAPASASLWGSVFERTGPNLQVATVGCCGMSGTYGHESRNAGTSREIFEMAWGRLIAADESARELLATGYSCRSQAERFGGVRLRHPVEVLLEHVRIRPFASGVKSAV